MSSEEITTLESARSPVDVKYEKKSAPTRDSPRDLPSFPSSRFSFLAEFLGTALFVFIGTGSVFASNATEGAGGIVGIALAFGLAISVLIYAFGKHSG
jgi:hypothetical protein